MKLCGVIPSLLLIHASGKVVSGRGYFGGYRITEVTKFSFVPGEASVVGNITYYNEPKGSVYLFMDTNWMTAYHNEPDCQKVKHAHTRIPIGKEGYKSSGVGTATGFEPEYDENKGYNKWSFKWRITHHVRTYGWYFVIADCRGFDNGDEKLETDEPKTIAGASRRSRTTQFTYTFDMRNPGDSHLPAEESWLPYIYVIVACMMFYFWISNTSAYKKKTGNGLFFDSHGIIKALSIAYLMQMISMACEILHLFVYMQNGSGIFILDFFSDFFEGISQLVIEFALLCLGNGWTLVDFSRRQNGKAPSYLRQLMNKPNLDDETPTLFVLLILGFMATIFQIINKVQGDDFLTFHDHAGIAGKFLLIQRLIFGFWFIYSTLGTISSSEVQGSMQMQGFLKRLLFFGSVWFFSFPALVFIASLFAHYLQHFVITGGVLIIQNLCITLLTQQFLSNSSWYAKVSEVASTGMLPGFSSGIGGGAGKYQ